MHNLFRDKHGVPYFSSAIPLDFPSARNLCVL